ncbi:MFS transporter [uncultured Maritimibacter sp.]|jgi:DHA1 family inner membrane transport protein|uniref:MFS transporter n=1 Tax=uncultured Maritimibacter sp. TaxID=991866 RepID=UPI000AA280FC|nr:MFS transporter [uncultured Maritimibacter sp.]
MTRDQTLALNLLSLALLSVGAAMFVAIGTLPEFPRTMGITRGQAGLIIAVYAFASAILAPLLQVVFGHFDRKRLVMTGMGILSLGMFVTALAPNFEIALAGRFIAATGGAIASPVASTLGASLVSATQRGPALAIIFGGMTIASATVAPLATWMGAHLGWRATFAAFGAAMLLFTLMIGWQVPPSGHGERLRARDLATVLATGSSLTGLLVPVVALAGLFATFSLITIYFFEHVGASANVTSLAMLLYGGAGVAGNLIARRVLLRWRAERAMVTSMATISVALLALFALPAEVVPVTLAMVVWSGALALFFPAQQQRMMELEPGRVGLVLALNASAIYVGMSLGSAVGGFVDAHYGLSALPLASAGLVLASLAILALSRRVAPSEAMAAPAE